MCVSHHSLQTYLRRKMLFLIFFLSVLLLPFRVTWAAEIAKWTFSDNTVPVANPPAFTCITTGNCVFSFNPASSSGLGTASFHASGATSGQYSWVNTNWSTNTTAIDTNKYFQIKVETTGYNAISVSFYGYRGGSSSPKSFDISYGTNGSAFTNLTGGTSSDATTGTFKPHTFDLSGVNDINNKTSVYFRIYGWNASGSGSVRIDDITVTGTAIAANAAPTASLVNINGTPKEGQSLTGNYVYSDAESDAEGTSTFKWYLADDAAGASAAEISGVTTKTYTLAAGDVGKFICFEVTPVALTNTSPGAAEKSTCLEVLSAAADAAPTATSVDFSGTLKQGQTLTGSFTFFDAESAPAGTHTYKWYRANDNLGAGETAISGATGNTYMLTASDFNKYISFEVTPAAGSGTSPGLPAKSSYKGAVTNDPPTATASITGTAKVGFALTGNFVYSDTENDSAGTHTYKWYLANDSVGTGASAISGAISTGYTTVATDENKYVCFEITPKAISGSLTGTAAKSAYVQIVAASANVAPMASGVSISGTTTVGQTLTGVYTFFDGDGDTEATSTFKWYRADNNTGAGASEIATTLSYTLTAADVGKYLRFEVTPVASGGTTLVGSAAQSKNICVLKLLQSLLVVQLSSEVQHKVVMWVL